MIDNKFRNLIYCVAKWTTLEVDGKIKYLSNWFRKYFGHWLIKETSGKIVNIV